jgi:hypothetical protein
MSVTSGFEAVEAGALVLARGLASQLLVRGLLFKTVGAPEEGLTGSHITLGPNILAYF